MNAPQPAVRLLVGHRDVTADFSPWLLSVSYVDHMAGEADGLELQLDNSDGRWLKGWYPVKGSSVEAWIGYEGAPLMPCGEFQLDEMDFSGPPDVVTLRALAAGARSQLRTRQTQVWEGVSLRQVVQEVAARHELQVVGAVPDLRWKTLSQSKETDLGFLQRLAGDLGVVFTLKGRNLVFHDLETLEAAPAVLVLRREDVATWGFRDKVAPGAASASYYDGDTGELQVVELQLAKGDQVKHGRRSESKAHAARKAKAALRQAKSQEREGALSRAGDIRLRAGRTVVLQGWGVLDGLWLIKSARHNVDRGGYRVDLEVRVVVPPTPGTTSAGNGNAKAQSNNASGNKFEQLAKSFLTKYRTHPNAPILESWVDRIRYATASDGASMRAELQAAVKSGELDMAMGMSLDILMRQRGKELT